MSMRNKIKMMKNIKIRKIKSNLESKEIAMKEKEKN